MDRLLQNLVDELVRWQEQGDSILVEVRIKFRPFSWIQNINFSALRRYALYRVWFQLCNTELLRTPPRETSFLLTLELPHVVLIHWSLLCLSFLPQIPVSFQLVLFDLTTQQLRWTVPTGSVLKFNSLETFLDNTMATRALHAVAIHPLYVEASLREFCLLKK